MQELKTPTLRKYFLNKLGLEVSNYYKDIKSIKCLRFKLLIFGTIISKAEKKKISLKSTIQHITSDVEHYRYFSFLFFVEVGHNFQVVAVTGQCPW